MIESINSSLCNTQVLLIVNHRCLISFHLKSKILCLLYSNQYAGAISQSPQIFISVIWQDNNRTILTHVRGSGWRMWKAACIISIIHLQLGLLGEQGESWQLFNNPQLQLKVKGATIQPKHYVKIVLTGPGEPELTCLVLWGVLGDF